MSTSIATSSILAKFNSHAQPETSPKNDLDASVTEIYRKVGSILSKYKSGKLPKALKVLPSLKSWDALLSLTSPETWTHHAAYQITRIFVSALSPQHAEVFLHDFLLPIVRRDFAANKQLSPHLCMSLKRAIYKPAAFFKGIVIPFCQSPDITLKESSILASILAKSSIPSLYSATAIEFICEIGYSGPIAIILRTLLDKRYALPSRIISSLISFFCSFQEKDPMPVLWHQTLLV